MMKKDVSRRRTKNELTGDEDTRDSDKETHNGITYLFTVLRRYIELAFRSITVRPEDEAAITPF
jgi:hypothetical protein